MGAATRDAQRLDPARFEGVVDGQRVGLFELCAGDGLRLSVCNHGARVLQLLVPDHRGDLLDVVLGYDSLAQVLQGLPSMGAFIGRYANRIAQARLPWQGASWALAANHGPHCLHGGPRGSRHQVFEVTGYEAQSLQLRWVFQEVDDGFPGDVLLELGYSLPGDGRVVIDYRASVYGRATVLSLTGHTFFNLGGQATTDILGHELALDADAFLVLDDGQIPTGEIAMLAPAGFDGQTPRVLADWLTARDRAGRLLWPRGLDHCFIEARGAGEGHRLRRMAHVQCPQSGVGLEVWSDAKALQAYAGGGLDASLPGHAGKFSRVYGRFAGLCLEPQARPDSPNHPDWPSVWHAPGSVLRGRIEYRFRS